MDPLTISSIITKSNIVELLDSLKNKSGDLNSLVAVYIEDNGEIHVLYAGFSGLELVCILEMSKIAAYDMIQDNE
jgi:hypothetical protein